MALVVSQFGNTNGPRPLKSTERPGPCWGLSDMRHGVLRDSDMRHGNLIHSTGGLDHFLNSTGRHYCFLKIDT